MNGPLRGDNAQEGRNPSDRSQQSSEAGEVVDGQIRQAASALFVEERRPIRPFVPVEGVCCGNATQIARGHFAGHEGELWALHGDWGSPEPELAPQGQTQQLLSCLQAVGDGLLAPHMLASLKGASVDGLMGLHVGEVDEEFEGFPGQHGVDARVVVGHLIRFRLFSGPFRPDISDAD